ncbi:hypothetical protein [Pelagicoccus albus]|uniref:Uncharacterized protein n=1 Tax=Pelagicoccus albus TaxID=415222 RepID=A0A7X1BBX5_9BACT|nr:hypothetical protein [Pelagicoccus albus]MBC2608115.1 hypothetical protein [Pelagicoccus albus]
MSLISQALKTEQQRRQMSSGPVPPMVTRLHRQASRDRFPLILTALVGLGTVSAICLTLVLVLIPEKGSSQLAASQDSPPQENTTAPTTAEPIATEKPPASAVEQLFTGLSDEELSAVKKLLLEQKLANLAASEAAKKAAATQVPTMSLEEAAKIQDIVEGFAFQGIRKAGLESKVFLDGKIRRIGEVVDFESQLKLVGFTETDLVFRTPDGSTFRKSM